MLRPFSIYSLHLTEWKNNFDEIISIDSFKSCDKSLNKLIINENKLKSEVQLFALITLKEFKVLVEFKFVCATDLCEFV